MKIIVAWHIAEYVLGTAVEYGTKIVQGLGADGFVVPEFIQGRAGDIVMVDQRISGFF